MMLTKGAYNDNNTKLSLLGGNQDENKEGSFADSVHLHAFEHGADFG